MPVTTANSITNELRFRTRNGTVPAIRWLPIGDSQTIIYGDFLKLNSSSKKGEQAITTTLASGEAVRAASLGKLFVALAPITTATASETDKIPVMPIEGDNEVLLRFLAAGTSAGAAASTSTAKANVKVDETYVLAKYNNGTAQFYASSTTASSGDITLREKSDESAAADTYTLGWFGKAE
jgi:hypothetical protein